MRHRGTCIILVDNQTRPLQRPTADGVASCYAGVAFGVWIWPRRGSGAAVTYAGTGANASPSYVGDVCEQLGRSVWEAEKGGDGRRGCGMGAPRIMKG